MYEFRPLKEVAELRMGETIIAADCDGKGAPVYSADTGDKPWNYSSKCKRLYPNGTIVIGARGSIGYPRMPSDDLFACTQTTIVASPNHDLVAPRFLFHALSSLDFAKVTAQQAIPMLTVRDLAGVPIAKASLAQQHCVAKVLDALDTTIRQTEAIIVKLKQLKQGLLHDLLTRGIDANGELRPPQSQAPHLYKQSPLGWIPHEWMAVELDDLIDPARPIVYGILMPGRTYEGGVPVVKVKDIINDEIRLDGLLLTSPQIDREYRRSRLAAGDLLFTIRGTVGRTAFVPRRLAGANITQDTARVGVTKIDPAFVRAYLLMPAPRRFIETHTLGVAVQGINLRDVRRIPICCPPTEEAKAIARELRAADDRIHQEQMRGAKLSLAKSGLMDDLLTGRIRVTPLLGAATTS